jgi:hypothetical protein
VRSQLLEAHRYAAISLELLEKALDQEAFLVEVAVVGPFPTRAAGPRWDHSHASSRLHGCNQRIRIVSSVSHDVRIAHIAEQLRCLRDVVGLAFSQG